MIGYIYDYPAEIRAAWEKAVDFETGEIIDEKALDELNHIEMERDDKCASVAFLVKDLEAQADQVRSLANAYSQKASRLDAQARKYRSWIEAQLEGQKIKRPDISIYYGSSQSAEIVDEEQIPDKYFKVERSLRKSEVLKALKNGEDIDGAFLRKNTYMVIKAVGGK